MKKILSLDGGGIKGVLTLGILKKIEKDLQVLQNDHNYRLGNYFDLIGGTSTGAIIGSSLAFGFSVDRIIELYLSLGKDVFQKGRVCKIIPRKSKILRAFFKESYSSKVLEDNLREIFGELTIGDNHKLICNLAINCKRADSFSLWTVTNHSNGIYYDANKNLKIWELCRASSAAPYYFKPKSLKLSTRKGKQFDATFIDGGVSLANNPAWQLFLVATVSSFGYSWQIGDENIKITSIGTGSSVKMEDPGKLMNHISAQWASKIPELFMNDASEMNQILLQSFGKNIGPTYHIDSQFGNLENQNYLANKLFSFSRHNVIFDEKYLIDLFDNKLPFEKQIIPTLGEMDHYENMEVLLQIGEKYAEKHIKLDSI